MSLRTEVLFRFVIGIALLVVGVLEIISAFLFPSMPVFISSAILLALLLIIFQIGMQMRCRDTWALYNEAVLSQRNSLVWYVSNAMHSLNPSSYQLLITESFYDKGKTLHTELAKLLSTTREESRKDLAKEIQNQLDEWETILNQLRTRIDQLDTSHRL
jgi:uncharacterized membrane protein